jgi:hypothetical protein
VRKEAKFAVRPFAVRRPRPENRLFPGLPAATRSRTRIRHSRSALPRSTRRTANGER